MSRAASGRRAAGLRSALASNWTLDEDVVFLNHGSFGACPSRVIEKRLELIRELESQPLDFLVQRYPARLFEQIAFLEDFTGAQKGSLALVPNATSGVNTVLRSIRFEKGDEVIFGSHEYFATRNAAVFHSLSAGAKAVEAALPFPLSDDSEVRDAVMAKVTSRTRLVVLDHVTSATGLVLDIAPLVRELGWRGIDVLIDGAHAPGMIPLNLSSLGAAYYTGNCHKWMCAPKVCAFLYVRPDRQGLVHPLALSHVREDFESPASAFQLEFMWNGTWDPTAALCVEAAASEVASLLPGGWPEVMESNRSKVLEGRAVLSRMLGIEPPVPEEMIGSLASLPLPWRGMPLPVPHFAWIDPLQEWLRRERGIEVLITALPGQELRLLRVSAQLYNGPGEYEYLARSILEAPAGLL